MLLLLCAVRTFLILSGTSDAEMLETILTTTITMRVIAGDSSSVIVKNYLKLSS